MGHTDHVKQFDSSAYKATVRSMRERGENVHAQGKKYQDEKGTVHPNVNIIGANPRFSHNAMTPGEQPGTYVLQHGISMPVLSLFDGTQSTAQWLETFFHTAERQYKLFNGARPRYNLQLATGVVNDVYNVRHDNVPVVQVSQFESDEKSADQVRLLLPASMGNDTGEEDYDLGLYYPLVIGADFWEFYGLKGLLTLTLDQIGKGGVTGSDAKKYLGIGEDFSSLNTEEICNRLFTHWNPYILQVPSGWNSLLSGVKEWWTERMGTGRVIQVEDPNLLAEIRAGLIYVTEAKKPTKKGFTEFLRTGDRLEVDAADLETVWRLLHSVEEHFSSQTKSPLYDEIPLPGDVFAHYRNPWPIGHPRENENPIQPDSKAASESKNVEPVTKEGQES